MDILRNLFGSVTSGIIRLLVTVGILAAAYFFIVKPVLNTTSDITKEVNASFQENGLSDISGTIQDVNKQVQREIRRSFHTSNGGNQKKLVHCIQRANGDVHRIKRCTIKY